MKRASPGFIAAALQNRVGWPLRGLMRSWILVSLGLALSSSGAAGTLSEAAPFFTRIGDTVAVPAEISGHTMFVHVMVNGHGPFLVMVDTGCSVTLVSPELAEAVGALAPEQGVDLAVAQNGFGDATTLVQAMLESVDLGGVHFEGVPAVVSESIETLSVIHGRRVDGALGFALFEDLFLSLDIPRHRLLLGSRWPAAIPKPRTALPLVEHANVPFVQVQIQGRPVELMVDTGSNQALQISGALASSLRWTVAPRAGPLVAVLGESGREQIGRLAGDLTLGDIRQVEPTAVVSTGEPSLGLRSLGEFCVVFHPAENLMWLCGPVTAPIPPTPERSDGLSLYPDPGGWRIAGIIPGSPAEKAGLTAGSLVTQIERQPATGWSRDQIDEWIRTHDGIALVVASDSGERALTLPAWDLVP